MGQHFTAPENTSPDSLITLPATLSSPVQDYICRIISNETVGDDLKRLTLALNDSAKTSQPLFRCRPGQFVMLDLPTSRFFFRRPMSVFSLDPEQGTFCILYKICGQGTRMIAKMQPDESIHVLGPLGNCFTPPTDPEHALFIGGGIGIAPLYLFGKLLQQSHGATPICFYGARSKASLGCLDMLKKTFSKNEPQTSPIPHKPNPSQAENRFYLASDSDDLGDTGFYGNVCALLETLPDLIQQAKEAYICGPTPMMKAVSKFLHTQNPGMYIEVSLEEHMPCGTGACTGCVVPRRNPVSPNERVLPAKVCVEGPVFDVQTLCWSELSKSSESSNTSILASTSQEAPPPCSM